MFGYVRPVLNQLPQEEKDAYQSAYCGLCHTMGNRYGYFARFTLNYDFTFLALLHYGCNRETGTACRRCSAHPFREPRICLCGSALEAAADESIILTWYKLSDDVADHGPIARWFYRFLRFLFQRAYRRARQARPEFDAQVALELDRLKRLEEEKSPQLDRVADTFASILAAAAKDCAGNEPLRRAMEQMLYHLGRWIYLVDAWDDLAEDEKKGRYNPLDVRFSGHAKEERAYVETTMTHSARLAAGAANLIEFGPWKPIVENIIYYGLPTVQKAVLDGRWKELRKQGRTAHERSV